MNNELSQFMNQNLLAPLIFIAMCIALFSIIGAILYYRFLSKWVHEKFATIAWFIGAVYILFTCVDHFDDIKSLVKNWNTTGMIIGMVLFFVMISVCVSLLSSKKKGRVNKPKKSSGNSKTQRPRTLQNRSDQEILSSSLESLSGAEFERLLALYFVIKVMRLKKLVWVVRMVEWILLLLTNGVRRQPYKLNATLTITQSACRSYGNW
jgi:restriction system protein